MHYVPVEMCINTWIIMCRSSRLKTVHVCKNKTKFTVRYLNADKVREVKDTKQRKRCENFQLRDDVKVIFSDTKGRK